MNELIADKLKKLREESGFTVAEVATMIHVDKSVISKMERGITRSWNKYLVPLLEIYNVDIVEFFTDLNTKNFVHQQNTDFKDSAIGMKIIDSYHSESSKAYERLVQRLETEIEQWEKRYRSLRKRYNEGKS